MGGNLLFLNQDDYRPGFAQTNGIDSVGLSHVSYPTKLCAITASPI